MCGNSFLIHQKDLNTFNNLWQQFLKYTSKLYELLGPMYDMCSYNPAIRIDCFEAKLKLIQAHDLNIQEVNDMIAVITTEFNTYRDNTVCTDPNEWFYVHSLKANCDIEYLSLKKGFFDNNNPLYKRYLLLQSLLIRKKSLDGSSCTFQIQNNLPIRCIDNKAVVITQ